MNRRRVLIVDDDEGVARAVKTGLEKSGPYEVLIETNPRHAKLAAMEFRPQIILLDIIMPEIDGGTLAADFRRDVHLQRIPILFLTSIIGKTEAASKGGMLAGEPVLPKPFTISELGAKIETCLCQVSS
jgi:DNA-binding response OmpR family regulator